MKVLKKHSGLTKPWNLIMNFSNVSKTFIALGPYKVTLVGTKKS